MIPSSKHLVALLGIALISAATPERDEAQGAPPAPLALSLGDAARLAARNSAQVEEAQFDIDEAQSMVHQRQQDLLPTYSASALQSGHTFNTVTFGLNFPTSAGGPLLFPASGEVLGPVNTLDVRGHVDEKLIDPGARERLRSARVGVNAASATAVSSAETAAAQAAASYLQVLHADAQLGARTSDSSLAADLLSIARDQLGAGTGVALDVTRAQAQLASVRSQLIGDRNNVAVARIGLLRSMGLSLDSPVQLSDSLASLPMPDSLPSEPDAVATAIRQRPDIHAIEAKLDVVKQEVVAIQAGRLPTLELFGDDGWLGDNALHLLPTYDYGIELSLPLFDGKRRAAQVEQQTAASQQLEVRERDLRQQVVLDVRSALLTLGSAREQVQSAREQLAFGEQEVTQARDRFAAGVAGNADVISALLSLTQTRTLLVDALATYQNARVALARAEGTVTELR
jgi:outer membrane protein